MADQDSARRIAPGGRILPEEVANRSFKSALRGISETDVRIFLRRVADEISRMRADEVALRERIAELENRLRNPQPLSEQQLLDALGEETAKVLRSAQDAADEIRSKAEERAALVRREAQDEAKRSREDADLAAAARLADVDGELQQVREAADAKAAAMLADAEARVQGVLDDAAREGERIRARAVDVAGAHIEDARMSGREMVAEARTVRERILSDLATRRGLLSEQIEELRAGRESLLGAYKVVKESLDAATAALRNVEARAAAELLGDGPDPATASLGSMEPAGEGVLIEPAPVFYDQDATEAAAEVLISEAGLDLAAAEISGLVERTSGATDVDEAAAIAAVDAAAEAALAAELGASAATAEPAADVEAEAGPSESAEPAPEVDALFAKLRAARESAVDDARHVLDDAAAPADADADADVIDLDAAEGAAAVAEAAVVAERTVVLPIEPGADDALRAAQHDAIDAVASGLLRKAKRVLQDEQNEMLDALRTAKRAPEASAVLPDRTARVAAWSTAIAPAVAEVYAAGWTAAGTEGAVPEQTPDPLLSELADALISPWRDRLAEAIDEPSDDTDAVTRVGARFRELRSQLLDPAVREVLAAAYARGVYDALPDGAVLRWVPAEVGHCPDCDDNALEPVTKGAPFPTGQAFPPAHPGCRCLLGTLTPAVGTPS